MPKKTPPAPPDAPAKRRASGATAAAPEAGTTRQLGMRRQPVRARGQETFERILVTTAELLEEVGVEGLTTNLLAQRSGCNISSLYQFFPNKQAILAELFRRQIEIRQAAARDCLQDFGTAGDWRTPLRSVVDAMAQLRREQRGNHVLREAMTAAPALRDLAVQADQQNADHFAALLRQRAPIDARQAQAVGTCVSHAVATFLDLWESPRIAHDPLLLEQLKQMLVSYLQTVLEPSR